MLMQELSAGSWDFQMLVCVKVWSVIKCNTVLFVSVQDLLPLLKLCLVLAHSKRLLATLNALAAKQRFFDVPTPVIHVVLQMLELNATYKQVIAVDPQYYQC